VMPIFVNQPVLAGQSYPFTTVISGQLGTRTLILTTSAGMVQLQTTCLLNVVP